MKYLIAGLGNIGSDYEQTRHNVGFDVVDELARRGNTTFNIDNQAFICNVKHKGRTLVLIKPTTYMNLSGKAIRYWMTKENIPVDHLLVILDDLNLPFGKLRLRGKGSDGGHNGLRNIQDILGRADYPRLRIGIGNDFSQGRQVNFVLGSWSAEERSHLPEVLDHAVNAVHLFTSIGLSRAMNQVNI